MRGALHVRWSCIPSRSMGLSYRWGVDLAGPLVETPEGYKYCMVAIEHFSDRTFR